MPLSATFFRGERNQDMVELKIPGAFGDTVIKKAEPEHVAAHPREWDAYQKGLDRVEYGGTDLREVPGIDDRMVLAYKLRGIHNAEMLARTNDSEVMAMGLGGVTVRQAARNLLDAKAAKGKDAELSDLRARLATLESRDDRNAIDLTQDRGGDQTKPPSAAPANRLNPPDHPPDSDKEADLLAGKRPAEDDNPKPKDDGVKDLPPSARPFQKVKQPG